MNRSLLIVFAVAIAAPAVAAGPTPGLYQTTTKMTAFSAKGMSPAQIKKVLAGPPEVKRECVTAEDLTKQWTSSGDAACRATPNPFVNGRINGSASCGDQSMKITGSYTASGFDMTLMTKNSQGSVTMVTTGRRIGNCAGGGAD